MAICQKQLGSARNKEMVIFPQIKTFVYGGVV